MLKRKAISLIENWVNTKNKKCLVVQGARQTGKTYIIERFAEEKYEDYFNIFFMDGGEYLKYVSMEDTKKYSQKKAKSKTHANYTYTVRVMRPQLKQRLTEDGVIKAN